MDEPSFPYLAEEYIAAWLIGGFTALTQCVATLLTAFVQECCNLEGAIQNGDVMAGTCYFELRRVVKKWHHAVKKKQQ